MYSESKLNWCRSRYDAEASNVIELLTNGTAYSKFVHNVEHICMRSTRIICRADTDNRFNYTTTLLYCDKNKNKNYIIIIIIIIIITIIIIVMAQQPPSGPRPPHYPGFTITQTHHTQ
jgi:hypothetical protein